MIVFVNVSSANFRTSSLRYSTALPMKYSFVVTAVTEFAMLTDHHFWQISMYLFEEIKLIRKSEDINKMAVFSEIEIDMWATVLALTRGIVGL